jgi:DNA-binding CsgD family transcriptional regulator
LTGADGATLIFRPPGRPMGEALHLLSGDAPPQRVEVVGRRFHDNTDRPGDLGAEEGKIYVYGTLYPPKLPSQLAFYEEVIIPSGAAACRSVRVMEPAGVSAWLSISRLAGDFTDQDDDLITAITPILRGALRFFIALEHERFTATITSDAMRRLHFGWMALDGACNILDHDPEAGRVFSRSGVIGMTTNGHLTVHPPLLKSRIFEAIATLSADPQARPRAFTLQQEPWLDMLLMSATQNQLSASPRASVIAYIHGDSWQATDRCEQLTQLFGLSRSEAKLALALSRGMTITQASESLGIKIETARKCSKLIYAKTGAGGLPDLVRLVMRSVLALAPKD